MPQSGQGQGNPGYTVPQSAFNPGYAGPDYQPRQGGNGSFIPQTPYSPGYQSPDYQPPQPTGYTPQSGYTGQGSFGPQSGYTMPQGGIPSQGGYAPQSGYTGQSGYTMPQGGYSSQSGYAPQSGYQPPMGNYPHPAGGYPGGTQSMPGGYQMPQGTPPGGYASQAGGQQPGGYMGGYNPYGQMGRPPQGPVQTEIPLNGSGYVPQRVPVKKRGPGFRDWYLIAAGVVLIGLFVAAVLILKSMPLKILLMILAAGSAGLLWIKPLTAENKRLTYSIVALALCVLTAVSFLMKPNADATRNGTDPALASAGNAESGTGEESGVPEIPGGSFSGTAAAETTPEPESTVDSALMERLVSFFTFWAGNRQDEMLALCLPSWQAKEESPRTSLFSLLANRTPKDCTPESISGTDADTTRKVTVTSTMNRNNGKPDEKYRMTIMMVKENGEWYIDPQSLQTYESMETPDPNITPTPGPTETPTVFASTVLYYNPSGGEYYHLDQNCKIINAKFLPLGGQFTYGEIGNEPYSKLKPCNVCGAPLPPE